MTKDIRESPSGKKRPTGIGFPITQSEFYIDSDTGNDEHDGASPATALRTLEGFSALVDGGEFQQSTQIFIFGDHEDESLLGYYQMTTGAKLLFRGMTATPLAAETLTGFTAESPGTDEARTMTVAGFDWSAYIGKRFRFLDGPAAGNVGFIAVADPGGVGADTVRVSTIANSADFATFTSATDPVVGNSFVIEDLTPIGGVDMSISQAGNLDSSSLGTVQFSDVDTSTSENFTSVTSRASNGMYFLRCVVASKLQGPGLINLILCNWSALIAQLGGLSCGIVDSLVTNPAIPLVIVQSIDDFFAFTTLFQGIRLDIKIPSAVLFGCGFFGPTRAIRLELGAGCTFFAPIYGGGFSDVGIEFRAGSVGAHQFGEPTVAGTAGDVRIGGSIESYGALPINPINGAGFYDGP